MANAYGVHLAAIGILTSAVFLTHAAVQLPAGRAIDRYGARGVGIASLLCIAVGNVVALTFKEFWVAVAARALMGLGTGAGFISGADYVRSAGGQAQMQGFYGGATLGATGLAVAIVPQLGGWQAPYWSALVLVLPVLAVLPFIPSTKRPPQRRSRVPLLSDGRLYRLSFVHTCSFGVSIVAGEWIVTLLVHAGHSHRSAALAGALTLIGGLVTRPGGGVVVQRRPERTRAVVAAAIAACALGMLLLASRAPLPVLALAALVVGLAAGVPFAAVFRGAQALRPDAPGTAVGLVNAVPNLFVLLVTPLVGLTFSLPGDGRLGFVALAAIGLAGLAILPPASSLGR
jgi:predicted MFS family arabinose efflux permease